MHRLTVIFGHAGINWAFLFRQKETADAIISGRKASPNTTWIINDDFGQHAEIQAPEVQAFMLEDMALSRMAAVESGLHQARVQAKAQEMAKSDPILRTAMRPQSPSVLTPHFPQ
jgi:hypothetical protein